MISFCAYTSALSTVKRTLITPLQACLAVDPKVRDTRQRSCKDCTDRVEELTYTGNTEEYAGARLAGETPVVGAQSVPFLLGEKFAEVPSASTADDQDVARGGNRVDANGPPQDPFCIEVLRGQ